MPAATPEDRRGLSFFAGRADRGHPIRTKAAIERDVARGSAACCLTGGSPEAARRPCRIGSKVEMTARIREFLKSRTDEGPCVVVDLEVVRENYQAFAKALPDTRVFYAVKANPAPEILKLLVELGSSFDVASIAETEAVLAAGAAPERISYGNTIKKEKDIATAFKLGVTLFAVDCEAEVEKVARVAPGSRVICRIHCDGTGSEWPLSRKFGCEPEFAADILELAHRRGLVPHGISFHVGSLRRHFGNAIPETIVEPGRGLVGNAGIIETEVVLIARRSPADPVRWVYLDIGKFHGLAETIEESIRYPIRTTKDRDALAPCIIAGPTCDSVDVLYEKNPYPLPVSLAIGDKVLIEAAGAYTTTYSSVGFNGYPPLRQYVI